MRKNLTTPSIESRKVFNDLEGINKNPSLYNPKTVMKALDHLSIMGRSQTDSRSPVFKKYNEVWDDFCSIYDPSYFLDSKGQVLKLDITSFLEKKYQKEYLDAFCACLEKLPNEEVQLISGRKNYNLN